MRQSFFNEAKKSRTLTKKPKPDTFHPKSGLEMTTHNALLRAGYGYKGISELSGHLDSTKIIESVFTGEIWKVRGLGEKRIKKVCEWLDSQVEA